MDVIAGLSLVLDMCVGNLLELNEQQKPSAHDMSVYKYLMKVP